MQEKELLKLKLTSINIKISDVKDLLWKFITVQWKLNWDYLTSDDEKQERINTFNRRFYSECQSQSESHNLCKKIELLNQFIYEFKSINRTMWRIVDPANG